MASAKLNALHLHLTDSQSWPLHLIDLPELAEEGAYSTEEKYTEQDLQMIDRYAGERGITVMLEVRRHIASSSLALQLRSAMTDNV